MLIQFIYSGGRECTAPGKRHANELQVGRFIYAHRRLVLDDPEKVPLFGIRIWYS